MCKKNAFFSSFQFEKVKFCADFLKILGGNASACPFILETLGTHLRSRESELDNPFLSLSIAFRNCVPELAVYTALPSLKVISNCPGVGVAVLQTAYLVINSS